MSFWGAGSRRTLGLLGEVLVLGDCSLPGEGTEGSSLAEVQPLRAVHKRRVRSRESVHTWPMSVGCGWLAAAMMCDPSAEP